MNRKNLRPLFLLLFFLAGLGAQAQVPPVPSRPIPPAHRSSLPAVPATSANAPVVAPVGPPSPSAGANANPNLAGMPAPGSPPAASGPGATNSLAGTNEPADITYNFPSVPVGQLLDLYADLVGRTVLASSSGPSAINLKDTTITLKTQSPLTKTQAIQALEMILGMNGITPVPVGDKFVKVTVEAQAGKEGGPISTNFSDLAKAGKMITQVIQIKYVALQDLVDILQPFSRMDKAIIALPSTQTLILRDYAENVDRMIEMVHRVDVLTPNAIKPQIIKIRYALASDISQALSQLGASGGGSVGKSSSGATSFGGSGSRSGNGFGNSGSGSGFGGSGGAFGSSGGINGGYAGQAAGTSPLSSAGTAGRSSFQQNLGRIVQNAAGAGQFQLFGQTKIIADERTNSLLVFANDEDMKMITNIIDKLDVVLPQVLIDAIVMEINLTGTESTGVSYLVQRQGGGSFTGAGGLNNLSSSALSFLTGSSSTTTNAAGTASTVSGSTLANLPGGFSYFAKFGNDLNVVMEAVAGDSRVNVLSRPRIQTSHAVPADLFIGNTVPYVTGTYNYGYGSGPSSQYTQLEVGIHLQVLPLINQDGLVVMDIQADVEQLGPDVQISGVGGVPTTTKRQAGAKVAVKDGETIILGGFISDSRSLSDSGIPGLKDIPWIGNLFKSRSVQNLRTELIMLMRPTVLKDPELAAVVATQERDKLSGVKEAELEIRLDEQRRNKSIEERLSREAEQRAKAAKKDEEKKAKRKSRDTGTNAPPTIQSIPPVEE